jgi:hypothetical protein
MKKRFYLLAGLLPSLHAGNCASSQKEITYAELMQKRAAANSEKKRASRGSQQITKDTIDRLLELTKFDD